MSGMGWHSPVAAGLMQQMFDGASLPRYGTGPAHRRPRLKLTRRRLRHSVDHDHEMDAVGDLPLAINCRAVDIVVANG